VAVTDQDGGDRGGSGDQAEGADRLRDRDGGWGNPLNRNVRARWFHRQLGQTSTT
jgi:hypothetical protein